MARVVELDFSEIALRPVKRKYVLDGEEISTKVHCIDELKKENTLVLCNYNNLFHRVSSYGLLSLDERQRRILVKSVFSLSKGKRKLLCDRFGLIDGKAMSPEALTKKYSFNSEDYNSVYERCLDSLQEILEGTELKSHLLRTVHFEDHI